MDPIPPMPDWELEGLAAEIAQKAVPTADAGDSMAAILVEAGPQDLIEQIPMSDCFAEELDAVVACPLAVAAAAAVQEAIVP